MRPNCPKCLLWLRKLDILAAFSFRSVFINLKRLSFQNHIYFHYKLVSGGGHLLVLPYCLV